MRERALVPVLVLLGLVVAAIGSLGAPLVPTVARADGVPIGTAQWTLTIALLVGAVATPILGRVGDGPHRRAVILGALGVVLAGSVLTAVPAGFAVLLVGRGLQGVGLGLTSLAIAIARDQIDGERSRAAVSLLSITTVAGIGLGYPLAGVATELWGLRAAYGLGALIVAATLLLAAVVLPAGPVRRSRPLDMAGAVLLGAAVAGLLYALTEAVAWGPASARFLALVAGSLALLGIWARHELRTPSPLVDLRLLRRGAVRTADVTVLFGGIGMYLLLSLVTRFVQTPESAGYGFGASVIVAGLVLTPFSLMGFVANRVAPGLARRTSPEAVLMISLGVVAVATLGFLFFRAALWQEFVVMGVAGFGVGCVFSAMPGFIVRSVPADETASAMSFNQVLRTVGFSAGSAVSGLVLSAYTAPGAVFPAAHGYRTASIVGVSVLAATIGWVAISGLTRAGARIPAEAVDIVT